MAAQYPDGLEADLPVGEDHLAEVLHRAEDHQEADIPQEEATRQEAVILREEAPTPAADTEPAIIIFLQMNRHPI